MNPEHNDKISDPIHSEFIAIRKDLEYHIGTFLEKHILEGSKIEEKEDKIKKAKVEAGNTLRNIESWLNEDIPIVCKYAVLEAVKKQRWADLVESFWQNITFGTGGIRAKMIASNNEEAENELSRLNKDGLESTILRGTNTINEVIIMKYTAAVARYMKKRNMGKVVVGYDSRMGGKIFSQLVAEVFLANGFTVYLFDDVTPIPELSFAVTNLGADMGIEITASHNDRRYNGYKIITKSGAAPSMNERNEIAKEIFGSDLEKIPVITMQDVKLIDIKNAENKKLVFLGGQYTVIDLHGHQLIDMHERHVNHIKKMILRSDVISKNASDLKIGYCAFYGAGYKTVPRLLNELGFENVKIVSKMNKPDPFFPSFDSTQMLDPGDIRAARLAVDEFIKEYGKDEFEKLDFLIGTDPDADRMALIVKMPQNEEKYFGKWKLLNADDVWMLLLWYRLQSMSELNGGSIPEHKKIFVVKSFVTTDSLAAVARKYGIECENAWVGFGEQANQVRQEWMKGKINVGMFEESNGFSIAGSPPINNESLGIGGHTLEKDGALAAVLISEIAAYAKANNTTIIDLINKLYLDPEIGYYATLKLQLPEEGSFEGVVGELHKQRIMRHLEEMTNKINEHSDNASQYTLAGFNISHVEKYSTGKYDYKYWPNFPDEGIRFFLDDSKVNHVTVRSAGTESKIRIIVQCKISDITKNNLPERKLYGEKLVEKIAKEMQSRLQLIN